MTLQKLWKERLELEKKMQKVKKYTTKVKYSKLLKDVKKEIDKKIGF